MDWNKGRDRLRQLLANAHVRRIVANMGWLFFDKFLRLGVGLFVGVWVARYLGPERYGLFNYVGAYVALFVAFATLGLDGIVVRELVKKPEQKAVLLGSAFMLKLAGSLLVVLVTGCSILWVRPGEDLIFNMVLLSSGCAVFQSLDTIDFDFQSRVMSKYMVWPKNAAFFVCALIKIILIRQQAGLLAFAWVGFVESALGALFLIFVYRKAGGQLLGWSPDWSMAKRLLGESWPLILSAAASLLNMRLDQVLIGKMLDDGAVGNYSAAVRISEIWLMIPGVVGASLYPSIIAAKQQGEAFYKQRLFQIFRFMCMAALPFAFAISLASGRVVELLYGSQYQEAGAILAIHIWSGVPYLVFFIFTQMFFIEGLIKLSFYTSLLSPICNVALNLWLIPQYGNIGSAWATLITAWISSLITLSLLNWHTGIFCGFCKISVRAISRKTYENK